MKKLMNTMASAAVALLGFGAFADLPSPSATFEGLSTGDKTVSALVTNDDAGSSEGAKYWFAVTNDSQALDAVIGVVTNETGRGNYFAMETSAPLYRTINSTTSQYGSAFDDAADAEPIGSDGIYLDTMVKFTVSSDDEFKDLDADVDKLAITCYSPDVNENESSDTNILVRAGYVDGSTITATNYTLNLPQNFKIDEWHRLTVRAIADVGYEYAPVGFAIYLDEELLTYSTAVDAGESAYVASLNAAVKQNLYNSETHALLPSLIDYTYNDCSVLSAVGFKGTGSVDDILFTDDKPSFIVEGQTVTIAWDAGVATYTVVDSNNKTLVDAASTSGAVSTNLTLDAGVTYLTVTATYANGYEAGEWTVTGDGAQISGSTFTVANGAALNIVSMLPKFDVGGTRYDSFEAALDAAVKAGTSESPATVKLLAACNQVLGFTEGYVILDLNGCDVQGGDDADCSIVNSGATLVITNSGDEASVKLPTNPLADPAITLMTAAGQTTIQAGTFDGLVIPGDGENILTVITGGKFLDAGDEFYLAECVASGLTYSKSGDYVIIGAAQPEPTKIDVPTAASNLVYDGEEQTGVEAGTGYTLSGDFKATNAGEYTATATLEDGYIWSDDSTEAKSINWSIAADTSATVVVTLTDYEEEYTAQLAFPTASATIGGNAVAGTSVWNPDTITEPSAAGVTNTYEVTFTVTGGNYAGSTGTAEFKVWKAAGGGGGDWPADPTEVSGQTAADAFGITGDLATADAGVLATWAKAKGVDYSDRTTEILTDAFLLDCANTQEAIDAAKANFKVTSITVVGDTVTITPTDAADYGNGQIVIEGATAITSPMSWHPKTTGDHFFRATLVVKPVTP